MNSYEVGNRSIASQAERSGRNDTALATPNNRVYRAKVLAVDDGYCQVATLDDNGNKLQIFSLVELPDGLTVAKDDLVTVQVNSLDDVPVILSGGGGGGCAANLLDIGTLHD